MIQIYNIHFVYNVYCIHYSLIWTKPDILTVYSIYVLYKMGKNLANQDICTFLRKIFEMGTIIHVETASSMVYTCILVSIVLL